MLFVNVSLRKAWNDAFAATDASKILVCPGTYTMNAVNLKGPCKAPSMELQVDGIIQAPANPVDLKGAAQWFIIGYVNAFTLSGTGTFGQGPTAWKANDGAKNLKCNWPTMINNIKTNFLLSQQISTPGDSPNTDGIHIGRSNGVTVANINIATGDYYVSLGDGNTNITVVNVTCGPGHGISVGSLGRYDNEQPVANVNVKNCTISTTMNGVRIKTWPGIPGAITMSDMHFEDIIMNNVSNPVIIDQEYCPSNQYDKSISS